MGRSLHTVRLPAGARDFLPGATARRRNIADSLLRLFESWGYERVLTPVIEVADVLDRGLGEAERRSAVRFVEPMTGEVVALRPDITPQIARIAATRLEKGPVPARLCYDGSVTRLNVRAGGHREVLQAGIELIDAGAPEGDAEALAVAAAALEATQLGEIRLDLGHVAFSRFAIGQCPAALRDALAEALARKDRARVVEIAGSLTRGARQVVSRLPGLYGSYREVLRVARAMKLPSELNGALAEIEAVVELSREQMPPEAFERLSLDLGEVRGFNYYTGLRFRGFAAGVGYAVLRGGRYDDLIGRYGRDACATGFAVDVEGIAEAQDVLEVEASAHEPKIFVVAPSRRRRQALEVVRYLRAQGWRVLFQQAKGTAEAVEIGRSVCSNRASLALLATQSAGWELMSGAQGDLSNVTKQVLSAAQGRPKALMKTLEEI